MSCFGIFRSGLQCKLSPSRAISTFQTEDSPMDPYAKPNERRIGANRPKISHLPSEIDRRTRDQRRVEKQAVAAERRAIKKAARRQLKKQLIDELNERQRQKTETRHDYSAT